MMDGIVATFSDITSKKKAEQKLRKNYHELITVKDTLKRANELFESKVEERTRELAVTEERFRLVASATNDALYDWQFINDSLWLNEAFFKLFGYKPGPEYSRRTILNDKLHPDERTQIISNLQQVINSGTSQWNRNYRFRRADGSYAHVLDRGYILKDEFGTPYRMLGSMFDVTDLKIAEHKLATMNEQLEHKVIERTQELEQINSALEMSNTDLQQFASVASHDLQEPLRKIQMFAQLINEEYSGNENDSIIRYVKKILHSSDRMRSLITDVLNYSRLSANNNKFEPVNLNELINGVIEDFELTITEKKAVIDAAPLPQVEAIPGLIRQVFQNLISNALKFSKSGTPPVVTIRGQGMAKRSFMSMPQENGPDASITIADNGIGFYWNASANIFNIFQRLHSKDKYEGTGIGLAITKKIIEKHNGIIRADSKEGDGSTFTIILPSTQNP